MSTAILPSLAGLGFEIVRTPVWETVVQQSISGKETRVARAATPRWQWDLTYNVLRSGAAYGELQQLAGFFNTRQGMFDTFLYKDADDHNVTGQQIALCNGSTAAFALVRSFGGFVEPVLAPDISGTINVYLDGVLQSPGSYIVNPWETADSNGPGALRFAAAPASGVVVTADFGYYFPVRMTEDSMPFTLFISQHYRAKKFSFISVKN